MKATFILFAGVDLLLLSVTAIVGLQVDGEQRYLQHFLLGVLAALFTLFVHVVTFTYFMVSLKVARQAATPTAGAPVVDGAGALHEAVARSKTRVLLAAVVSIVGVLLAAGLGAIVTEPGQAAAWGLSPAIHGLAGFVLIGVNLLAFARHYAEIDANARRFERHFGRPAASRTDGPPRPFASS